MLNLISASIRTHWLFAQTILILLSPAVALSDTTYSFSASDYRGVYPIIQGPVYIVGYVSTWRSNSDLIFNNGAQYPFYGSGGSVLNNVVQAKSVHMDLIVPDCSEMGGVGPCYVDYSELGAPSEGHPVGGNYSTMTSQNCKYGQTQFASIDVISSAPNKSISAFGTSTACFATNITVTAAPWGNSLDLRLDTPQMSQSGAAVSAGGNVNPGVPVQITIPVLGSGFNSPEARTTTVILKSSSQTQSQNISLADIQSGRVSTVTFNVTFGTQDLGLQTITATIDPGNALQEKDFTNNAKSVQVKMVGPKLAISNTVLTQAVNNFTLPGSPAQVDLVKGKSTAAIFDVSVADGSASDPTPVTITVDLGDGSAPITYPALLTIGQIVSSVSNQDGLPSLKSTKTIKLSTPPLRPSVAGGPNTVTFKASASGIPNATATKQARVKETKPLEIVYSTISSPTLYGQVSFDAASAHLAQSDQFMQGAFPVSEGNIRGIPGSNLPNSFGELPGSALIPLALAAPNDLISVCLQRTLINRNARNGVGIVTSGPTGYFQYHAEPDARGISYLAQLSKVGLSQFILGCSLVAEGYYVTTAHEIGHTFGLLDQPDDELVAEYWVDRNILGKASVGLMGPANGAHQNTIEQDWISANEYTTIFQGLLTNKVDPQVMIISGTIDKDGIVSLQPTYYFADGIVTPFDASTNGRVNAVASDGSILAQASFELSYDLITSTGKDIPTDLAAFIVQLPMPQGADSIQIVQNGRVLATFNPNAQLLKDAINSIPNQGFDKNPSQRRNALLNKVNAFIKSLEQNPNQGPLNMLQNDIRKSVNDWVLDNYLVSSPLQLQKVQVLATIDAILAQLKAQK